MSSKNGKKTGSIDKILITGASGFLGREVFKTFQKKYPQTQFVAVSRKDGNLENKSFWKALPRDFTGIIHLAAYIDWHNTKNSKQILQQNLLPIENLARFAKENANLRQIIYSSSISVCKPSLKKIQEKTIACPVSAYSLAKLKGEKALRKLSNRSLKVACLRFSSLYGPGQYAQTVLPVMMNHALTFGKITVFGKGRRQQDFLNVKDAADIIGLVYEKKVDGIFNAGYGKSYSMKALAKIIASVTKNKAKIVIDKTKSEDYPGYSVAIQKAHTFLNFSPKVTLKKGIQEMMRS